MSTRNESAINAATIKLPAFAPSETLTWFRLAETKFRLKNITSDVVKADCLLEALPESVIRRLSSWLNTQPDIIQYTSLKRKLLDEFSMTASERAQRVLSMPSDPIGDRTPRQVWDEIESLCRLPEDNASGRPEVDLKKEIWLQCLPSHVRSLLNDAEKTPMEKLVKKADSLSLAHKEAQTKRTIASAELDTEAEQADEIAAVRPPPNHQQRRKYKAAHNTGQICTYHQRFGDRARKCAEGCTWKSKNSNNDRQQ
jgi:hypothetical protein